MNLVKILSLTLIFFTVVILFLFIIGKASALFFWVYMAVTAIIAYKVVPKIGK